MASILSTIRDFANNGIVKVALFTTVNIAKVLGANASAEANKNSKVTSLSGGKMFETAASAYEKTDILTDKGVESTTQQIAQEQNAVEITPDMMEAAKQPVATKQEQAQANTQKDTEQLEANAAEANKQDDQAKATEKKAVGSWTAKVLAEHNAARDQGISM